ncbi:hypothetical protein GCM10020256_20720 [Streptomyces thermocoprophilus]
MSPKRAGVSRATADATGEVVVLLIGMRINRFWAVHEWLPVLLAMPRMLAELKKAPRAGTALPCAAHGLPADVLRGPVLGVQGEAVRLRDRPPTACTTASGR